MFLIIISASNAHAVILPTANLMDYWNGTTLNSATGAHALTNGTGWLNNGVGLIGGGFQMGSRLQGAKASSYAFPSGYNITIIAWINKTATDSNTDDLFGLFSPGADYNLVLNGNPATPTYRYFAPAGFATIVDPVVGMPIAGYQMVVLRKQGTNYSIFNNATIKGSKLDATAFPTTGLDLGFGRFGYDTNAFSYGANFDEISIWNTSLTDAQILGIYNAGAGCTYPFTACADPVNPIATVNQTFPSNNSQFNFSSNLYFWVTSNVTINNLNTTLFVDGVNTQSKLTANGNDVLTNFTGINFSSGTHSFYIQYKNDTTTVNTTTNTFFIDLVFPAITSTLVNNSIYYTSNFTQFFAFIDDQMLSSYNITLNGVSIYSNYSLVTNYSNVTVNQALSNGANTLQVRVADGHTKSKIDTSAYTKHDNDDYLQFTKANKQFKIYEKGNNAQDIFTATAGYDRYTFDYTPKIIKSSYTFVVEATDDIRIIDAPNTPYKKWLIIGDNWIDFYMDDQPFTIDIIQKNKKATEVTISGFTNGNKLRFKSIGELNILTATYSLFKVNTTQTFTTPTLETKTETYTLNITREATQSSTAYLRYNASNYNATKTTYTTYDEYLASLVVPFTSVNVSISNGLWNFTVNNSVSNLNTTFGFNQTVVQMLINNCTTIIGQNAVNWTIKDDSTEATVIGNTTGFFTVWYTNSSLSRSFSLAWMNTTSPVICQLPNETLRVTYTVTYGASGYATKHKSSINTPFNWTTIIQTLYLTPGAASVVVNTIDQISNPLVGYLVEMYRFDSSTNNYTLSQSEISDYGGNGLFSYLAANQYKFIIYNTTGDNIYDTGATHIIANPTIIKVGTVGGTDIATPNIEAWSLRTTLYNVSRHVYLNWTTLTGTSGTICLNISKTNATNTNYLYGACSSTPYGSLDYNVTESDGTINAIAWIKGSTYVTNILSFVINSVTKLWQSMGVSSMLIYIILIIIAVGVSITSVQAMPYAIGIANIVAMWLGVISWSWGFVVVILAALLIIADRVRD